LQHLAIAIVLVLCTGCSMRLMTVLM